MRPMKNIVQFSISQEDGGYIAEGMNVPVVTEADTLDELAKNIKEAVELYFDGENLSDLGFGSQPSIMTSLELTPQLHGTRS
jgi:predicted RNase H-like HicB family nuclease